MTDNNFLQYPEFTGENASLFNDLQNFTNASMINFNMTEQPYTPFERRPETYIVPVLFALIFLIGVLGNGTLVIVFIRHRAMRNVPNTYILSLALADLLVIVISVPFTSTVYTVDNWPWGSVLCTLSEFSKDVSIGVSVFTLTALSADRFFAIVDPLRKFHGNGGGKRATRTTIATALLIWVLAIICGLPALVGTHVAVKFINKDTSFSFCYPFPEEWGFGYAKLMILARFLVYYAIPLFIIGIFYVLIARNLILSAKTMPGEMQGTAIKQQKARRKVAVTVLAFVGIFGVCFFPSHLFMLWFYYNPTSQTDYNAYWHILRIVGFCLSFANSCANPVALYCVSGAFRKHFNRYLLCIKVPPPQTDTYTPRETSMTTTMSRRYPSRRMIKQNTISRQPEMTTTVLINGTHNRKSEEESCILNEQCL